MADLAAFDEAVRMLAEAGRSRDQIARELGCTYWKVRKSIVRLGISVAEGKRGRKRTRGIGDPDHERRLREQAEKRREEKRPKGLPVSIFD